MPFLIYLQEVRIQGQDVAFKDLIEPLESVSVSILDTQTESLASLGSPTEVRWLEVLHQSDQFVIWGFEPHHLVLHILHSHQHSKFNILKTLLQIAISIYRLQSYSSTRCLQPQDRNLAYKMRFLAT